MNDEELIKNPRKPRVSNITESRKKSELAQQPRRKRRDSRYGKKLDVHFTKIELPINYWAWAKRRAFRNCINFRDVIMDAIRVYRYLCQYENEHGEVEIAVHIPATDKSKSRWKKITFLS